MLAFLVIKNVLPVMVRKMTNVILALIIHRLALVSITMLINA